MRNLTIFICAGILALGLSACGRKGDLAPPPSLTSWASSADMPALDSTHASF